MIDSPDVGGDLAHQSLTIVDTLSPFSADIVSSTLCRSGGIRTVSKVYGFAVHRLDSKLNSITNMHHCCAKVNMYRYVLDDTCCYALYYFVAAVYGCQLASNISR